jgi:mono/diheme cytochrome c family protein
VNKLIAVVLMFLVANLSSVPFAAADAKKGEELFNDKKTSKCLMCHAIGKKVVGPDLAGVSKRHTKPWIVGWLTKVQATWDSKDAETMELRTRVKKEKAPKPAHMPPPLTEEQAGDIADFLMTQ